MSNNYSVGDIDYFVGWWFFDPIHRNIFIWPAGSGKKPIYSSVTTPKPLLLGILEDMYRDMVFPDPTRMDLLLLEIVPDEKRRWDKEIGYYIEGEIDENRS